MALLTKSLVWDLFVMYMFICVIFIVSCCILVSYMFLLFPAKSQHEIRKCKQDVNHEGNLKNSSIRSTPIHSTPSIKNELEKNNYRNYRSKSINIIPLSQVPEQSIENETNEFSLLAFIESCQPGTEEKINPGKNK